MHNQFFKHYDFINFTVLDSKFTLIFDENFTKKSNFEGVPLRHSHEVWEIYFITSGELEVDVKNEFRIYRAGTYTLIPPNTDHCIVRVRGEVSYASIRMSYSVDSGNSIETWINELILRNALGEIEASEEMISCFARLQVLYRAYKESDDGMIWNYLDLSSQSMQFISCLLRGVSDRAHFAYSKLITQNNLSPVIIEFFMSYLLENDMTITDLAQSLDYSLSQTHRLLKQKFGKTFRELVNESRMQKAEYYLLRTDYPIGRIAKLLKFKDAKYFNSFFKREAGMTPYRFRKKHTYRILSDVSQQENIQEGKE